MSTLYKQGISSCEIGGAVALALLHDLHVNLSFLSGVPQVTVFSLANGKFPITLSWEKGKGEIKVVSFELDEKAAFDAATKFKKEQKYDKNIFQAVQKAMAELESIAKDV